MEQNEAIRKAHAALRRASEALQQQGRAIVGLEERVRRLEMAMLEHELSKPHKKVTG